MLADVRLCGGDTQRHVCWRGAGAERAVEVCLALTGVAHLLLAALQRVTARSLRSHWGITRVEAWLEKASSRS